MLLLLLISSNSPLSQKIMKQKDMKSTLAKVNSEKLAKDQLKEIRTAELERASRRKLGNRVVPKGRSYYYRESLRKNCR